MSSSKPSVGYVIKIHWNEAGCSPGDLCKSEVSSRAISAFVGGKCSRRPSIVYVMVNPLTNQPIPFSKVYIDGQLLPFPIKLLGFSFVILFMTAVFLESASPLQFIFPKPPVPTLEGYIAWASRQSTWSISVNHLKVITCPISSWRPYSQAPISILTHVTWPLSSHPSSEYRINSHTHLYSIEKCLALHGTNTLSLLLSFWTDRQLPLCSHSEHSF